MWVWMDLGFTQKSTRLEANGPGGWQRSWLYAWWRSCHVLFQVSFDGMNPLPDSATMTSAGIFDGFRNLVPCHQFNAEPAFQIAKSRFGIS